VALDAAATVASVSGFLVHHLEVHILNPITKEDSWSLATDSACGYACRDASHVTHAACDLSDLHRKAPLAR